MADLNDFNKPDASTGELDFIETTRAANARAASLDPGSAANRPIGVKRAGFGASIFTLENWSGSAWVEWLRATPFGRALIGASDADAGQTALGASAVGKAVFTAANAAAARSAIGAIDAAAIPSFNRGCSFGVGFFSSGAASYVVPPSFIFGASGVSLVSNQLVVAGAGSYMLFLNGYLEHDISLSFLRCRVNGVLAARLFESYATDQQARASLSCILSGLSAGDAIDFIVENTSPGGGGGFLQGAFANCYLRQIA